MRTKTKPEQRSKIAGTSVTPSEKEWLDTLAAQQEQTLSNFLRKVIFTSLGRKGLMPDPK